MQIETERLRITALTPEQLDWWLNDLPRLEEKLNCSYQAEPLEGIFKEIVSGTVGNYQTGQRKLPVAQLLASHQKSR